MQGEKTQVLLIEDNPGDARLIEEQLHLQGGMLVDADGTTPEVELVHEERLADGLERLDVDAIDVVLLDLMLPDSKGEETLDRVLDHTSDVPIVLLTGLRDRKFGVDAVQRGAQDYLVKGEIDGKLLVRTMRYAIERKKNERELANKTEQLAILNRILRHDIRNDMNVVIGMADHVRDHVGQDGLEHLETIQRTGSRVVELTSAVGTLLDTITGREEPDLERVSFSHLLETQVEKARRSHVDAIIEIEGNLPSVEVYANYMLSSVFSNLLNNAVQHNPNSEPRVDVSVTVDDGTVRAQIADDGRGIPDDRKASIFGRGEKGLESTGTGIGLYLVATLVEQFDGEIRVEDNESGGATFVVALPTA